MFGPKCEKQVSDILWKNKIHNNSDYTRGGFCRCIYVNMAFWMINSSLLPKD